MTVFAIITGVLSIAFGLGLSGFLVTAFQLLSDLFRRQPIAVTDIGLPLACIAVALVAAGLWVWAALMAVGYWN